MPFMKIFMSQRTTFIAVLLFVLFSFNSQAQVANLEIEEVQISEDAKRAAPELKNATCYRVWLIMPDSLEATIAVFGSNEYPLEINSTESFWQSGYGEFLGSNINSGLMQVHPELAFDSWVTLGMQHNRTAGTMYFLESPDQAWTTAFEDGEALIINDRVGGSWFSLPGQANTIPTDGRILIGQFTTEGKIEVKINCQLMDKSKVPVRVHALSAKS
jgi:hypothetical protein